MNTLDYNKLFLCDIVWHPERSPWIACRVTVPPRNPWARRHPLVCGGKGFWHSDTIIVVGYTLKCNRQVFRPIYSLRRNKRLMGVGSAIQTHVARFIARLRRNMMTHAMLGVDLPVSVIRHIGAFV